MPPLLRCASVLAALLVPANAAAQPLPIVAVVEVRGVAIDPQEIRAAVAERSGRPVLSPLELGEAISAGTLTIACETGRALVHYRDASGRAESRAVALGPPAQAVAVIADAAALLARRTAEPFAMPSEVLDPFAGTPGSSPEVAIRVDGEEVLNPWQPMGTPRAHGLAPWPGTPPPRSSRGAAPPGGAAPAAPAPAVPPAIERADSLSVPRPGAAAVD